MPDSAQSDPKRGPKSGWNHTPEARAKIAIGLRRYFADPENRRKRGEAIKAGHARRKAELQAKLARLAELEAKAQA